MFTLAVILLSSAGAVWGQTTIYVDGSNVWTEYGSNPLFGGSGGNVAYYPSVLKVGSTYHIWYGDGSNTRHASSANANFSSVTFPAPSCTGLSAGAYHPRVLYKADGWTIGGNSYAGPFLMYSTTGNDWTASPRVAHSADGDSWTDIGACTGVNTYVVGATVYNFDVLFEGGTTWKAYADNGEGKVEYYTSTDGLNWTGVAHDILGAPLQLWETLNTSPHAIKVDAYYVLFYGSGGTPSNQAIGMAVSTDGQHFTKSAANPIFSTTGAPPWRDNRTYTPSVFQDAADWKMYFAGKSTTGSNYSIGYATNSGLFRLISDAINAASSGDIINVAAGTYNEDVSINKNLTLTPAGGTTIQNITVTGASNIILGGDLTLSGTLTLTSGTLDNSAHTLTLGNGATISRATGSLSAAPTFGTSVNVTYTGSSGVTTGNELPSSSTVLNNLTINNSGGVTLNASRTVNGDLTISSGTLDLGSFTADRGTSGGTITVGSGAGLKIGGTNTFPANYSTHTLNSASTVEYSGTTQSVSGETYGSLTISGNGTKTLGATASVAGTLTLTSGTLNSANNLTLASGGAISRSAGALSGTPTFSGNNDVTYTASLTTGSELPSGSSALRNLTINPGGSNTVSLNASATVNGTLTLTSGLLILGSNNLTLGTSATVSGTPSASNMVAATGSGGLRKTYTTTGSFTFPVGDNDGTAEYSPVTLNFTSGSFSSAYAGVKLTNSKYPNNSSSTDFIDRYWTISSSGITGFSCDASFVYVPADVHGTESNIYCESWNGSSWTLLNATNSVTHTLSGTVTSFSDFTGGEQSPPPTVTTGSATGVTTNSAELNGTVNANGTSTTARFQYGAVSGSYTGTSTTQAVSGTSNTAVSIGISGLSSGTMYYYRIAANNSSGTSTGSEASFTTTSAPPPPPPVTLTVNSTSPSNGAAGVAVNTTVSATFSLLMNGSTLTTSTFKLSGGGGDVSGVVTTNGATATFTPSTNLSPNTTYTATITTGAQAANYAGTTLDADYTWSFTTESAPAVPTPTLTATPSPTPATTPSPTPTATPSQPAELHLSKEVAYLSGDTVVVTVVDADRNTDTTLEDTLTTALKVTALNYYAGGDLTLDLKENAVNSGTFLATIKTGTVTTGGASVSSRANLSSPYFHIKTETATSVGASVRSNSGTIKAVQGGTATVIYTDTTPYASSLMKTLTFSSFDAALSFNADTYSVGSYTEITLADAERNTNHTEAESLLNDVFIETSFVNSAKVRIVETGADTGTFMGSIQIVTSGGTLEFERIQASAGEALKVTYTDEINTTGFPRTVTDSGFVTAAITPAPTATPTVTATSTPLPTPSVTPTPGMCNAELITVSPKTLKLRKKKSDDVMVTLTGEGDCPVEGETVKARITKGKRFITVSPASAITNDDGQAEFTITALKKTSNSKVQFKSGNVKTLLKVKVVLTPLPTPTATPTPGVCKAKLITVSPRKLKLKKKESDDVMVTLTGKGGCPVAGKTVKARITKGKGFITVSPASAITNDEGQAVFTITALKKTSNSTVQFKSGNVEAILKVKVVK